MESSLAIEDSHSEDNHSIASKTSEEIVHQYLYLVKYAAHKMVGKVGTVVEVGELINEGVIGLIDAHQKFDPKRPIKFATYAVIRINGQMMDYLRATDWTPRAMRQAQRKMDEAYEHLSRTSHTSPTNDDLAEHLGWSIEEVRNTQDFSKKRVMVSIDERQPNLPEWRQPQESIPDTAPLVDYQVEKKIELEFVNTIISNMNKQMQSVIKGYYFHSKPIRIIAQEIGVSESRVSQVHSAAIKHLKEEMLAYHAA